MPIGDYFTNVSNWAKNPANANTIAMLASVAGQVGAKMAPDNPFAGVGVALPKAYLQNQGQKQIAGQKGVGEVDPKSAVADAYTKHIKSALDLYGQDRELGGPLLDSVLQAQPGSPKRVGDLFKENPELQEFNANIWQIPNFGGQVSGNPTQPQATSAPSYLDNSLSNEVAMGLSPEAVESLYKHGLDVAKQRAVEAELPYIMDERVANAQHLNAAAADTKWKMSPEGQEFALRHAGEAARIQSEGEANRDAAKIAESERQFAILRQIPMSNEARIATGTNNWSDAIRIHGNGIDNIITSYRQAIEAKEDRRSRLTTEAELRRFALDEKRFESLNNDIIKIKTAPTIEEFNALSETDRILYRMNKIFPMSKEEKARKMLAVKGLEIQRDATGMRIYGKERYEAMMHARSLAEPSGKELSPEEAIERGRVNSKKVTPKSVRMFSPMFDMNRFNTYKLPNL
jgi:hypothetical protein